MISEGKVAFYPFEFEKSNVLYMCQITAFEYSKDIRFSVNGIDSFEWCLQVAFHVILIYK